VQSSWLQLVLHRNTAWDMVVKGLEVSSQRLVGVGYTVHLKAMYGQSLDMSVTDILRSDRLGVKSHTPDFLCLYI